MNFRLCPICRRPLPEQRRVYCSEDCKHSAQYRRNKARYEMITGGAVWPPAGLFWDAVNKTDGDHWVWTGCLNRGVPCFRTAPWPQVSTRRWAWHVVNGDPIPKILHVRCGEPACVNPAHLSQAKWTHCKAGHDLAGAGRLPSGECRACAKRRNQEWYAAKKQSDLEGLHRTWRAKEKRNRARQRLVAIADQRVMWSVSAGKWLLWDGRRWTGGSDSEAYQYSSAVVRERMPELQDHRRAPIVQWLVGALRRLGEERAARRDENE